MFVQGPQHLLDAGVQFDGDLGGRPFPVHIQVTQQFGVEVFAVFPAGPGLDGDPGGLQPGPDGVPGGVVLVGDLFQGAALGHIPAL